MDEKTKQKIENIAVILFIIGFIILIIYLAVTGHLTAASGSSFGLAYGIEHPYAPNPMLGKDHWF